MSQKPNQPSQPSAHAPDAQMEPASTPEHPELLSSSPAAPQLQLTGRLNPTKTLVIHPAKAVQFPQGKFHLRAYMNAGHPLLRVVPTNSLLHSVLGPSRVPDLPKNTPKLCIPWAGQDFCPCTRQEQAVLGCCWLCACACARL